MATSSSSSSGSRSNLYQTDSNDLNGSNPSDYTDNRYPYYTDNANLYVDLDDDYLPSSLCPSYTPASLQFQTTGLDLSVQGQNDLRRNGDYGHHNINTLGGYDTNSPSPHIQVFKQEPPSPPQHPPDQTPSPITSPTEGMTGLRSLKLLPCSVCGETSSGFHCGAITCEACKKFFIRSCQGESNKYVCTKNGSCEITRATRTQCQKCRYEKCIKVGMVPKGSKEQKAPSVHELFSKFPCSVCEAPASGFHFGAVTCEGCKGFFRRSTKEKNGLEYYCEQGGNCPVTETTRNTCRYCRYKKCLEVGMSLEGSRIGRQPNYIKHKILQIQQDQDKQQQKSNVDNNTLNTGKLKPAHSDPDLSKSSAMAPNNIIQDIMRLKAEPKFVSQPDLTDLDFSQLGDYASYYDTVGSVQRSEGYGGVLSGSPPGGSTSMPPPPPPPPLMPLNNMTNATRTSVMAHNNTYTTMLPPSKMQAVVNTSNQDGPPSSRMVSGLPSPRLPPPRIPAGSLPAYNRIPMSGSPTSRYDPSLDYSVNRYPMSPPLRTGNISVSIPSNQTSGTPPGGSPRTPLSPAYTAVTSPAHTTIAASPGYTASTYAAAVQSPAYTAVTSPAYTTAASPGYSQVRSPKYSQVQSPTSQTSENMNGGVVVKQEMIDNFLPCSFSVPADSAGVYTEEMSNFVESICGGYDTLIPIKEKAPDAVEPEDVYSIDKLGVWKITMAELTKNVHCLIKFGKKIPGFRAIPMEDQICLVRHANYIMSLAMISQEYDLETKTPNFYNLSKAMQDRIMKEFAQPYAHVRVHLLQFGERIKSLNMDLVEYPMVCAMILVYYGCPELKDPERVQILQDKIAHAFQAYMANKHGPNSPRYQKILSLLPDLHEAGLLHIQRMSMVKSMADIPIPALLAEMYIT